MNMARHAFLILLQSKETIYIVFEYNTSLLQEKAETAEHFLLVRRAK